MPPHVSLELSVVMLRSSFSPFYEGKEEKGVNQSVPKDEPSTDIQYCKYVSYTKVKGLFSVTMGSIKQRKNKLKLSHPQQPAGREQERKKG